MSVSNLEAQGLTYGKTNIADLVLIYHGGVHRPMEWNEDQFLPYVVHEDAKGKKNWLFDGFLFLEFKDGKGREFAPGYEKANARKQEWMWLANRHFEQGKALSALDRCIENQIKDLGKPFFKHKVIIGIPSPILNQKDWGELDGQQLDFSIVEDRLKAVDWYLDMFLKKFKEQNYQNLELEGFYWVDESVSECEDILPSIGDNIRDKGYRFFWIPYWKSYGHERWKELGFDFAWLQPNHFFSKDVEDQRINNACALASSLNMGLEMEFDGRALAGSKANMRNRLLTYIEGFEENLVYKKASLAYYEGGNGIYLFSKSDNVKDTEMLDILAEKIIKRKKKLFFKRNFRKK
ncbi:hypothetical protein GCM10025777_00280 [Membranihabitans marinus]